MSTAGPAWGDTARTEEAPVTLGGGGLVDLPNATKPQVFTEPASMSFQDLDVTKGSDSRALLVRITDAGGGAGMWQVELSSQATSPGASLDLPPAVVVPPGGEADLVAVARGSASAKAGEDYGFILLHHGSVTRKIPYEFFVGRPQLELLQPKRLVKLQVGETVNGPNRVSAYCCPAAPFGPPPDYVGPTMNETGTETLYVTSINQPVANIGVAVEAATGLVHPWFLGSPNERDVQGYAGTPVNVNELTYDFGIDIGAAGASFPKVQRFYVSVDSGSDEFTHRSLPGAYVLRSWVNDMRPPKIKVLTKRVAAGRPTIVARVVDKGAGVDPLSLVIAYRGALVGAALYDPVSGTAIFPLPTQAPRIKRTEPHGSLGVRLSGGEERQLGRQRHPAEHGVPAGSHHGRLGAGAHLGHACRERMRRQDGGAPGRRRLDEADHVRAVLRRRQADRHRPERRLRPLRRFVEDAALAGRTTRATRDRNGRRRAHNRRDTAREGLPVDRIAVVTGASRGIGEVARARSRSSRGWQLVLLARREERLRALAARARWEYEVCDVSAARRRRTRRSACSSGTREIKLLVNNAGIPGRAGFRDGRSGADRSRCVRTNYLGGVWCLRALPARRSRRPDPPTS